MNHTGLNKTMVVRLAALLAGSVLAHGATACTFSWKHGGEEAVFKRIQAEIGKKVTDEYCKKYNDKYEIFITTSAYMNKDESLGHAIVGLRKRGTDSFPVTRMSAYRMKAGNFGIGVSYELAAAAALDEVVDVMSDLDSYAK